MNWVTRLYAGGSRGWMQVSDVQLAAASMPAQSSPVIGISGADADSKSVTAMMTMVRTLGATPLFLGNHGERIRDGAAAGAAEALTKVDAVIVMGNDNDIDPAKYGQAALPQTHIEQDAGRAAFEEELIRQAIVNKMPLLGICGGMQRINVVCGGTLHQHVPDLTGSDAHNQGSYNLPGFVPVQKVEIQPGTLLAKINGCPDGGEILENSFHHQAINLVGNGLRVNAVAADGLAQGIEGVPGGPLEKVLGVQFHPEFAASALGPALIGHMAQEARTYAQAHQRTHHPAEAMVETIRSSLKPTPEHAPLAAGLNAIPTGMPAGMALQRL